MLGRMFTVEELPAAPVGSDSKGEADGAAAAAAGAPSGREPKEVGVAVAPSLLVHGAVTVHVRRSASKKEEDGAPAPAAAGAAEGGGGPVAGAFGQRTPRRQRAKAAKEEQDDKDPAAAAALAAAAAAANARPDHVVLEWESDPVSDMVADALVALVLTLQAEPTLGAVKGRHFRAVLSSCGVPFARRFLSCSVHTTIVCARLQRSMCHTTTTTATTTHLLRRWRRPARRRQQQLLRRPYRAVLRCSLPRARRGAWRRRVAYWRRCSDPML